MPLQKLSTDALRASGGTSRKRSPYVFFVGGLRVGEGGRASVAEEGVSRQQIKNRLRSAADDVGVEIKFMRSSPDEVVFRVVSRRSMTGANAEDAAAS